MLIKLDIRKAYESYQYGNINTLLSDMKNKDAIFNYFSRRQLCFDDGEKAFIQQGLLLNPFDQTIFILTMGKLVDQLRERLAVIGIAANIQCFVDDVFIVVDKTSSDTFGQIISAA